jgi:hypothetical protein
MAQITLTLPNGIATRFSNSILYQPKIIVNSVEIDNPETALQHAKRWIKEKIKGQILLYEADIAAEATRQSVLSEDLTIT